MNFREALSLLQTFFELGASRVYHFTSSSALCAAGAAGCCCCSADPPGVAAAADAAAPEPPAPPPGFAADGELPGETNLCMVVWSPPLCGCVGCAMRLCVSLRSLRQPEYMGFR